MADSVNSEVGESAVLFDGVAQGLNTFVVLGFGFFSALVSIEKTDNAELGVSGAVLFEFFLGVDWVNFLVDLHSVQQLVFGEELGGKKGD